MLSLRRLETKFIKGIGPTRAELLEKELGIRSAWDLLHHFPKATSTAPDSTPSAI